MRTEPRVHAWVADENHLGIAFFEPMSPCAACLTAALDNDLEVPAYGRDVREPKATIDGLTVVAFMKTHGPADTDLCHGTAPGSQLERILTPWVPPRKTNHVGVIIARAIYG